MKIPYALFRQFEREYHTSHMKETLRFGQAFWNRFGEGENSLLFYETDYEKARQNILLNHVNMENSGD